MAFKNSYERQQEEEKRILQKSLPEQHAYFERKKKYYIFNLILGLFFNIGILISIYFLWKEEFIAWTVSMLICLILIGAHIINEIIRFSRKIKQIKEDIAKETKIELDKKT